MRKVEEHADVAFHASWHEARLTSKEEGWTPPAGVPAEYTPQAVASFKIDEKAHSKLVNEFDGGEPRLSPPPSVRSAPCERVCDRSALQRRRRRGHHESSPLPHSGDVPSRHPTAH